VGWLKLVDSVFLHTEEKGRLDDVGRGHGGGQGPVPSAAQRSAAQRRRGSVVGQ